MLFAGSCALKLFPLNVQFGVFARFSFADVLYLSMFEMFALLTENT
jgi:hypothetical protein